MSAYKNFKKYITHIDKFSSDLCFTMLSIKRRFCVARDDSEYRSIKPNAINNHGGITRSTTSTHKGRRGNVRRTLNANANVRVFPVNHLNIPTFRSWKPVVATLLFLAVKQPSLFLSSSGDNFSTHGIMPNWLCEKDRGAFYPCSRHLSRSLEGWNIDCMVSCDRSQGYRRQSF